MHSGFTAISDLFPLSDRSRLIWYKVCNRVILAVLVNNRLFTKRHVYRDSLCLKRGMKVTRGKRKIIPSTCRTWWVAGRHGG